MLFEFTEADVSVKCWFYELSSLLLSSLLVLSEVSVEFVVSVVLVVSVVVLDGETSELVFWYH
jgi:hypothetical protein